MSSGRGGYRRGRNSNSNRRHQTHENWTLKPIHDHDIQTNETCSSQSTPQNRNQNRRNSRWAPRNRGGKSRFVKKSEKEEEGSNSGSSLNWNPDSNCGGNNCEIKGDEADSEKGQEKVEELDSRNEGNEDDVVRRLEELRLSSEESELSEEVQTVNKQLQEDELLAMESIYGDNIFIMDEQSSLKCFQAHIHVEVPKGLRITAKFDSEKSHSNSSEFAYSFEVEHLPPIILACLLPKSYPSMHAPYFTISVQWLGSAQISHLCSKIGSIWQELAGQEVIYEWVEWLRSSSLSFLDFVDEVVLGPYGVKNTEDRRAISRSVSPDIDIPLIKSYDAEQRREDFCRNIQECCICFNEFTGSEFIRLPCQHFFCEKCMKTFCDMHMMEGTVLKLKCPETKCDGMIPPGLLKRLLGNKEFERWESLTLQKTLESMADVVYCPRCETACLGDEEHAQCSNCYYSFCTLCRERRHVGVSCMTPEMKLIILQERQNSRSIGSEQRRREEDMINQLLSMKEIHRFAKQCPSCKMAISRTEGCNKMVCDNCGQYFCYRCNKAISGYEHFRDGQCELFSREEIQMWEARMNPRQIVGQAQAQLFPNHAHACPICGQQTAKVGNNNHIFCWLCQNHHCYLCRKIVKRSSNHYGPKGCKQHTVG